MTLGCFCIGTNQVELEAAAKAGVGVFNAPFSNTRSVAELIICEVIALSRQLTDRTREVHEGKWRKIATGSHEIRGKTLGIIGYGHIGSQVSVLAEAMGMRVLVLGRDDEASDGQRPSGQFARRGARRGGLRHPARARDAADQADVRGDGARRR